MLFRSYALIVALGILAHIVGDLITNYGTMIWAPLSDARVAWGTTFIIDLWFSGIILAGLVASRIWKRLALPAALASLVLFAYVGFQAVLRAQAIDYGYEAARKLGIEGARVLIGFRNGDLSQPFAETFEQSSPVTNITIGQTPQLRTSAIPAEMTPATLHYKVALSDGTSIDEQTEPVKIYAKDTMVWSIYDGTQWNDMTQIGRAHV